MKGQSSAIASEPVLAAQPKRPHLPWPFDFFLRPEQRLYDDCEAILADWVSRGCPGAEPAKK